MAPLSGILDRRMRGLIASGCIAQRDPPAEIAPTREDLSAKCGVPPLYKNARMEDFPVSVRTAAGTSLTNLLICGSNGVGKTHLAAALAFYFGARWCSMWHLLLRVRRTFHGNCAENELEILTQLSHPQVLVIDDILAAQKTDFGMSTLLGLLNMRIEQCRTTIVTCDRSLEDIDKIDSSLASRLAGFERLQLSGLDRRLK